MGIIMWNSLTSLGVVSWFHFMPVVVDDDERICGLSLC